MTFKKLYLPCGLIMALAASFLHAPGGNWLKANGFVPLLVVAIFLVSGWNLKLREIRPDINFVKVFVLAAVLSLLVAPFIGLGFIKVFCLNSSLAMGLIIMSCVPPTLSSGVVMTEISGGNIALALFITVGVNMLGIFTVPFMVKFCLMESGGLEIKAFLLLKKLLLLVLLPFVTGLALKKLSSLFTKRTGGKVTEALLRYIPSTCVIIIVYAGFSSSADALGEIPLKVFPFLALAAFSIHVTLLLLAFSAGKFFNIPVPESKALIFVSSQKTLPVAASVIATLNGEIGGALISCLLFHFLQLIFDSFLAGMAAKEKPREEKLESCPEY